MKILFEKGLLNDFDEVAKIIEEKFSHTSHESEKTDDTAINVGSLEFVSQNIDVKNFLTNEVIDGKWILVYETESGGFYVSAFGFQGQVHALLNVVDIVNDKKDGDKPFRDFRKSVFKNFYENYDDCSFGFARCADGFDLVEHIYDIARIGFESFDINRLADDIPIQVRERRNLRDVYPWWCTYSSTLDMYYDSFLNQGVYNKSFLESNRKVLLESAYYARKFGLKPTFQVFEPRAYPERFFDKHPDLRGARVDYDAYSSNPEYALDPCHPSVKKHYKEMMSKLLDDVPDLDIYEVWSQDSAAGFPWAECLYQKKNGPLRDLKIPFHEIVHGFLNAHQEAVDEKNLNTRISINVGWVFSEQEQIDIIKNCPEKTCITFRDFDFSDDSELSKVKKQFVEKNKDKNKYQNLEEAIGCLWKKCGPLFGMPTPVYTYERLKSIREENNIENLTARGGIISRVFVNNCINNEVIREFKYKGSNFDLDALLKDRASRWTDSEDEAKLLYDAWKASNDIVTQPVPLYNWTFNNFVSARTLFRKMVRPMVADPMKLTYEDKRYYEPYLFLSGESDPTWYDISYFKYEQAVSDEQMQDFVDKCENLYFTHFEKILPEFEGRDIKSKTLRDVRDRLYCYYYMLVTERNFTKIQLAIHRYYKSQDANEKLFVQGVMKDELENLDKFIKLLKNTEFVLIPETSGEETPYMFKAPVYHLLEVKKKVMEKHLSDDLSAQTVEEAMLKMIM